MCPEHVLETSKTNKMSFRYPQDVSLRHLRCPGQSLVDRDLNVSFTQVRESFSLYIRRFSFVPLAWARVSRDSYRTAAYRRVSSAPARKRETFCSRDFSHEIRDRARKPRDNTSDVISIGYSPATSPFEGESPWTERKRTLVAIEHSPFSDSPEFWGKSQRARLIGYFLHLYFYQIFTGIVTPRGWIYSREQ